MAGRGAGVDWFLKECTRTRCLKDDTTFNSFLKSEETGGGWDALKKDALVKAKLPWGDREEASFLRVCTFKNSGSTVAKTTMP